MCHLVKGFYEDFYTKYVPPFTIKCDKIFIETQVQQPSVLKVMQSEYTTR